MSVALHQSNRLGLWACAAGNVEFGSRPRSIVLQRCHRLHIGRVVEEERCDGAEEEEIYVQCGTPVLRGIYAATRIVAGLCYCRLRSISDVPE